MHYECIALPVELGQRVVVDHVDGLAGEIVMTVTAVLNLPVGHEEVTALFSARAPYQQRRRERRASLVAVPLPHRATIDGVFALNTIGVIDLTPWAPERVLNVVAGIIGDAIEEYGHAVLWRQPPLSQRQYCWRRRQDSNLQPTG